MIGRLDSVRFSASGLSHLKDSTHAELIALTGSDKAGMARTIDNLVESGLIARQVSSTDRRVNRLTLTGAGVAVATEARERATAVSDQLFGAFTDAELSSSPTYCEGSWRSQAATGNARWPPPSEPTDVQHGD